MAICVYKIADGELVSYCPDDASPVASADELAANGLAVKTGLPQLDTTHIWDAATQNVVVVAAPAVSRFIPTWQYIKAYTPAESAAIRASADATVQHILYMLSFAQTVDMNSADIQQGVGYLVAVGLLTQERAAVILATQAS